MLHINAEHTNTHIVINKSGQKHQNNIFYGIKTICFWNGFRKLLDSFLFLLLRSYHNKLLPQNLPVGPKLHFYLL